MILLFIIIIVLLGYLGINTYFVIFMYSAYKDAGDSLPDIAQRDAITEYPIAYYVETLGNYNPEYICGLVIDGKPTFERVYENAIALEELILKYQKSSKSIYLEELRMQHQSGLEDPWRQSMLSGRGCHSL